MELVTTLASWFTPTTLFLLLNFTIGTIFFTNRLSPGSKKHQPHQDGFGSGHTHGQGRLARPPSFVDRVKSINFSLYNSPPPQESEIHFHGSDPNPNPPPSLLQRVRSFNMPSFKFPQHNPDGDYSAYELTTRPEDTNRVDPAHKIREDDVTTLPQPSLLQRVKSIKLPSLYRSEQEQSSSGEKPPERTKSEPSKPAGKGKKKKAVKKMTKSASEKVGYVGREEETVEAVEKRRPETTRVEKTTSIDEGEEGVDDKASDFINKFKQQLKLQRLDSFLRYREMLKNN